MCTWQTFMVLPVLAASRSGPAAAAGLAWDDGRLALPVFVLASGLMAGIAWGFTGRRRETGLLLWLALFTMTGFHAVFAQAGALQVPWQSAAFLLGAAVFLVAAGRTLKRLDPDVRDDIEH